MVSKVGKRKLIGEKTTYQTLKYEVIYATNACRDMVRQGKLDLQSVGFYAQHTKEEKDRLIVIHALGLSQT